MKKTMALSALLALSLCSTAFAADHREPPKKPPVEQQHNGQPQHDNQGPQHDGKGQPPRDNKGPQHDGKGQPPRDHKGSQHDGKDQPPKHHADNKLPAPNAPRN